MDEIFNILSSTARIDKSKRKKKAKAKQPNAVAPSGTTMEEFEDAKNKITPLEKLSNSDKNHSVTKQKQIHQEEVAAFRNRIGIHLSQGNKHDPSVPDPISSFGELSKPAWWKKGSGSENKKNSNSNNPDLFQSLTTSIVRNIENGRWINPTPIQMQGIPSLLSRRDVLGCAPTGSGKSGAFIVPMLYLTTVSDEIFYNIQEGDTGTNEQDSNTTQKKKGKNKKKKGKGGGSDSASSSSSSQQKIRALLLAPSRELASQLHREIERLGEGKVNGIKSALLSKNNMASICANSNNSSSSANSRGLDVLVSTPLRLVECLKEEYGKKLDLSAVRMVVLDEADRLLDASDGNTTNNNNNGKDDEKEKQSGSAFAKTFLEQIDTILSHIPETAVRALFSATIGSSVRHLAESILRNEIDISTGQKSGNSTVAGVNDNISQSLMFVGKEEGKLLAIRQIIAKGISPPVIIFLQSKDRAQALFMELMYDGVHVDVLHAGKSQAARDAAVARFRKGETWVLICTDLCARGMDFKAVNMVINYDLPTSGVTYVHRIGRCGRGGRKGEAITLFTEADFEHLRTIANVMKHSGCEIPEWMLNVNIGKGGRTSNKNKIPIKRKTIDTTSGYDRSKKHKKIKAIENSERKKKSKQTK